ncbi:MULTISPECIES: hypothetical protein [Pyrobaculum]|uniref:Uncharacterized protein n=3 Tax=Pyrobaculum TaxID=2276 RepID=A4WN91_PYRAR|nr:hypothetical protein [Pyrobaculum arsenaticum]ABP51858.1 conserved hypothetical protein [Pyrobaculum arsenaticum DSM 13514]AFA40578.1 hypothetical protein Pogu_2551 [Pyrobaculum oguniense TE7]MCY0891448.1 hypothetical protein [Pyrobaculum arsenaticum]NYR16178.1 hypothetical protein [Pyrobaculum arsenaticum]
MHRGIALVDWREGLVSYVEADDAAMEEFRRILKLCGGSIERRALPCLKSLVSRVKVKSVLYITDLYGISNLVAFEQKVARQHLLDKIWSYLDGLLCTSGDVECGEDVRLSCCKQCGDACMLATVVGLAHLGVEVDLRDKIRSLLGGES